MVKLANLLRKQITATVLATICGFIVAAIILQAAGYNSIACFSSLFNGIFSQPKYISNIIIKSTPIILTGVSVAFAFKTGLLNMGAEGQYIMGTIAAVIIGTSLDLPMPLQILAILVGGTVAGALFGAIVGLLKAKFGIHEVISGIMLNWIALYFNNFIVNLPVFHQPNSTSTYMINESGMIKLLPAWKRSEAGRAFLQEHPGLGEMLIKTDLNFGILIAIAVIIVVVVLLKRSSKGYQLRAVGLGESAAQFAGINVKKNVIHAMLISGAIAGLAGAIVITGMAPNKISVLSAFENNGWNGLSVSLIAGNSPIGCLFAGLLFGGLLYGGQSIQSEVGAPSEIISIMLGIIVFFIALTKIIPKFADKLEKRGEKHAK